MVAIISHKDLLGSRILLFQISTSELDSIAFPIPHRDYESAAPFYDMATFWLGVLHPQPHGQWITHSACSPLEMEEWILTI